MSKLYIDTGRTALRADGSSERIFETYVETGAFAGATYEVLESELDYVEKLQADIAARQKAIYEAKRDELKLYTIGNLSADRDYVYGVVGTQDFGTRDFYGPFTTETEASNFAHQLAVDKTLRTSLGTSFTYNRIEVVTLQSRQKLPAIVRSKGSGVNGTGYEYAS